MRSKEKQKANITLEKGERKDNRKIHKGASGRKTKEKWCSSSRKTISERDRAKRREDLLMLMFDDGADDDKMALMNKLDAEDYVACRMRIVRTYENGREIENKEE